VIGTAATALEYASRGWPVFPVHVPAGDGCSCGNPDCEHVGKHPRTQHGLIDATTDDATIRQWWAQWPGANIGIRTGLPSGIVVLDIDPRHGGDETLADLERQHGALPSTIESITGGGGRHIFFVHPGGEVKSHNVAPGIDVKADGGYIVVPPSLHFSGSIYEWEGSSHPDDVSPALLPAWLLAMVTAPPEKARPASVGSAEPLREGKRNMTLTSLAGVMRRAGMEQSEIRAALLEINNGRCTPCLPVQEVVRIAASVSRYAPASVVEKGSPASSSLYRGSDSDDDVAAPVELRTLSMPGPRQWTVEDWLPAGAPTVLYGDGGMAKSLQAMLIADCVARGRNLFGRRVQQGKVLYLDWELDQEEQTRRAYRVAAGLGYPLPAPGLFYRQMVLPLSKALEQIAGWVGELQIALIILDSYGLATLGDPKEAKEVVPLFAQVARLPCTSLFIDHIRNLQPGESAADLKPFGSVYKFNIARSVIRAVRVGGDEVSLSVLLRQTKSNFAAISEPLGLRITFEEERVSFERVELSSPAFADALAHLPALDKVRQALVAAGKAHPDKLASETGLKVGTVKNKLTELRGLGQAVPSGDGDWEAGSESSLSFPLSDDDDDDAAQEAPAQSSSPSLAVTDDDDDNVREDE
jgi:hypothetical protein